MPGPAMDFTEVGGGSMPKNCIIAAAGAHAPTAWLLNGHTVLGNILVVGRPFGPRQKYRRGFLQFRTAFAAKRTEMTGMLTELRADRRMDGFPLLAARTVNRTFLPLADHPLGLHHRLRDDHGVVDVLAGCCDAG